MGKRLANRCGMVLLAAMATACGSNGMSTEEIRAAAIEQVRKDQGLAANAPLQATVWTGAEYDGEPSICGTVSSTSGGMRPQRFLARLEPFEWLVFEDAHSQMLPSQPDKFAEWSRYCPGSQG